jgi:hypothetical protein
MSSPPQTGSLRANALSFSTVVHDFKNPLPDAPLRYAPILVGGWLVAGVLVLLTVPRASNIPLLPLDKADLQTEDVPL